MEVRAELDDVVQLPASEEARQADEVLVAGQVVDGAGDVPPVTMMGAIFQRELVAAVLELTAAVRDLKPKAEWESCPACYGRGVPDGMKACLRCNGVGSLYGVGTPRPPVDVSDPSDPVEREAFRAYCKAGAARGLSLTRAWHTWNNRPYLRRDWIQWIEREARKTKKQQNDPETSRSAVEMALRDFEKKTRGM